jgi:crotonobetainyl-CoA:carnitine CoA-transferase CaiB-like acyl-CoA transferase
MSPAPLSDCTVLDVGVLVAGPMVGAILGDFGARVIKIEQPGQPDPMRQLFKKNGVGLFSKMEDRNKLPITLNLKTERGKDLFAQLAALSDVVVENYRPGVMERLGFPDNRLLELNSRMIVCHVSGWGQTGPYRQRGSFGRVAEAFGGFAHLNGEADGPPMHSAVSLGDSLASVWAALGVLLALRSREADGLGQVVDVGLYEPTLRQIEQQIVVADQLGQALKRVGNRNPGVATVNTYLTSDGKWFSASNATPRTMRGMIEAVGLGGDSRFDTFDSMQANADALHEHVSKWMSERTAEEVERIFAEAGAVGTAIRDARDLLEDPHVRAREMIVDVPDPELGSIRMQGVVPKLSRSPGAVRHAGRPPGDANHEIYGEVLGLSQAELESLRAEGVI